MSARIENGTLRVVEGCCPNLLAEAGLYRYSDAAGDRLAETPMDEHNHALAALRYLVSKLDARHMARRRTPRSAPDDAPPAGQEQRSKRRAERSWLRLDNEALWTTLGVFGRPG